MTESKTAIVELKELSPGFGAEILGLELANGATTDQFRQIQEAVTKYGAVVIRATKLTDESHIALARMFGELDDVKPYITAGRKNRLTYDELFDVSNVEIDGTLLDPESPRGQANKGNSLFHVDSSFNPRRAGYSLLLAHELPPPGHGGATAFADTRSAFDDLDEKIKNELFKNDYVAAHSNLHSRKLAAPEYFAHIDPTNHPMGRHKLLQLHERSGRMNLYLAAHIHHIEGLEPAESKALFDTLFEHCTQSKYVIHVEWKNPGDLVIWDNTCVMHRAQGGSFVTKGGVGDANKPPCASCHRSGSNCVLAGSSRGGCFRSYNREKEKKHGRSSKGRGTDQTSEGINASTLEAQPDRYVQSNDEDDEIIVGNALPSELRNPSDALHILAQSDNGGSSSRVAYNNGTLASAPKSPDQTIPNLLESSLGVLEDYELIKRGLLHPNNITELLQRFLELYHTFCPITPAYMFDKSLIYTAKASDSFLLTVLLTIASRDSPSDFHIHRACWEHTQRLLLDVLLARPWTQTARTVEGLLLLSEWLPHIQSEQNSADGSISLLSDDRTAWSLIGLAVRHGYLLRLDQTSFRYSGPDEKKKEFERKRLIWTFVYLADRQISVRLGQSFWSRGPSLSAHFTAKDFSCLKSIPGGGDDDHASLLQATMELTQILYNAHGVLYSSRKRTLAMVSDGDYNIYLDDFQRAASVWHATWNRLPVRAKLKTTLLLMYEYLCLYVNAFSFQAVLTRNLANRRELKQEISRPFDCGIMSSPDGHYVFSATSAATNVLKLLNSFDSTNELHYLPARYLLYGVYAAVFLYKADCAGAIHSAEQRSQIKSLFSLFTMTLEEAAPTDMHIARRYSHHLKSLWQRKDEKAHQSHSAPKEGCQARITRSKVQNTSSPMEATSASPTEVENTRAFLNKPPFTEESRTIPGMWCPGEGDTTRSLMDDFLFEPFVSNFTDFELGDFGLDSEQVPMLGQDLQWTTSGAGDGSNQFW
ncbi:hypothetical protein BX600DRAFT_416697 [Xylariales sp. PMI_506]|nr:hypothetical protein BX600DRAFT_416697 [Xylariales sp. PMI_506]